MPHNKKGFDIFCMEVTSIMWSSVDIWGINIPVHANYLNIPVFVAILYIFFRYYKLASDTNMELFYIFIMDAIIILVHDCSEINLALCLNHFLPSSFFIFISLFFFYCFGFFFKCFSLLIFFFFLPKRFAIFSYSDT